MNPSSMPGVQSGVVEAWRSMGKGVQEQEISIMKLSWSEQGVQEHDMCIVKLQWIEQEGGRSRLYAS